jgi:hypothetical protein
MGQLGLLRRPRQLAGKLGKNERFEQRAERRSRPEQRPSVGGQFVGGDARVDEDQLRGGGGSGAEVARPAGDPFDQEDLLQRLEVTRYR